MLLTSPLIKNILYRISFKCASIPSDVNAQGLMLWFRPEVGCPNRVADVWDLLFQIFL